MLKLLAATAAALISVSAPAATISLTGNDSTNGTYGNARTFSSGGISVRVSAWQATPNGSGGYSVNDAYLGRYGNGVGVTGVGDNNGGNLLHTVDNAGGRFDFVLLQFDRIVSLTGATLNTYTLGNSTDNDAFVSAGITALPWTSTLDLDSLPAISTALFSNGVSIKSAAGTPASRSFASYVQAGNIWIVGADFFNTDGVDGFKMTNLIATPAVPEPATWAMMIGGFGFVGAMARRRSRTAVQYA